MKKSLSDEEDFYDDPLSKEFKKRKKEVSEYDSTKSNIKGNYEYRVIMSNLEVKYKSMVLKKLKEMSFMDNSKYLSYINNLLKIPFGIYSPVLSNNTKDFLISSKQKLDSVIYSQDEVKNRLLDFCCKIINKPDGKGGVIALQSLPGTGKTILIRQGLSKILNRPFFSINFGGLNDPNVLTGHDYTYNGSSYGRIVQILIGAGVMDPIIYLDEIDKISGVKSQDISGVLTHLLDESQNTYFSDNYFQGIHIDLSRVLFVISYNNEDKVDSVVSDRMSIIRIKDLTAVEKTTVLKKYILPEVYSSNTCLEEDVLFTDEALEFIVQCNKSHSGLRQIKKLAENIIERSRRMICLEELHKPVIITVDFIKNNINLSKKDPDYSFMYS